jgi:hypothetical protein
VKGPSGQPELHAGRNHKPGEIEQSKIQAQGKREPAEWDPVKPRLRPGGPVFAAGGAQCSQCDPSAEQEQSSRNRIREKTRADAIVPRAEANRGDSAEKKNSERNHPAGKNQLGSSRPRF